MKLRFASEYGGTAMDEGGKTGHIWTIKLVNETAKSSMQIGLCSHAREPEPTLDDVIDFLVLAAASMEVIKMMPHLGEAERMKRYPFLSKAIPYDEELLQNLREFFADDYEFLVSRKLNEMRQMMKSARDDQ